MVGKGVVVMGVWMVGKGVVVKGRWMDDWVVHCRYIDEACRGLMMCKWL